MARSGFVARGLIYWIIGVLALKLAIGAGGKTANQQGALKTIAHDSYGPILLGIVSAGLIAFGLYSLADVRYRRI